MASEDASEDATRAERFGTLSLTEIREQAGLLEEVVMALKMTAERMEKAKLSTVSFDGAGMFDRWHKVLVRFEAKLSGAVNEAKTAKRSTARKRISKKAAAKKSPQGNVKSGDEMDNG